MTVYASLPRPLLYPRTSLVPHLSCARRYRALVKSSFRPRKRQTWTRHAAERKSNGRRGKVPTTQYEDDGWDPHAPSYNYPPTRNSSRLTERDSDAVSEFSSLSPFTNALIGGAFVLGIGAGVYFASEVTVEPANVASTEIVDRRTPSSEICMANGFSSMVFDQRLFVSFNPFNVYVAQPEIKPGCILRRSNVNVLERRKLVSKEAVETCKKSMNTFAFVGDLKDNPEISCVYHSEDAENQFLVDPKRAVMGDGYQAKPDDTHRPAILCCVARRHCVQGDLLPVTATSCMVSSSDPPRTDAPSSWNSDKLKKGYRCRRSISQYSRD